MTTETEVRQPQVFDTGNVLIATNIGLIITIVVLIIRLTWFLAKMDARIDRVDDKAGKAHERLDGYKTDLKELRDEVHETRA